MTDALFSSLELPSLAHQRTGYRLDRIEVYNWGTFHRHVWALSPGGQTSLLTGDIGSGKSTLVDAITTLLLPAHRVAYNKAAGADARERTLRSYVEGHYKSERNEATGTSRPVGLRDHTSYSVVLGVFRNEGYDETVTIAQVFHQKDHVGQPDRFFVVATTALGVDPDFSDFGSDLKVLRARLRASGAEIDATFPEYGRRVRRLLGIRSEQAMELFHQTVSMKSVGNLNEFVRGHMLEPVDAADRVRVIVDHFENLTKAHEAVRRATDQLALLDPLVVAISKYDRAVGRQQAHSTERESVGAYVSELSLQLLAESLGARRDELAAIEEKKSDVEIKRRTFGPERDKLIAERAGIGGDRLGALDVEIPRAAADVEERADRRRRYADLIERAGLAVVGDAESFRAREVEAQALRAALEAERDSLNKRQAPFSEQKVVLRREIAAVVGEIESLTARPNNLPTDEVSLRTRLCEALGIVEADVPFVGELLDVREEAAEWRGAAERVLRSFALNLLVSQRHYDPISRWVNANRLGAKLVYLRVSERRIRTTPVEHASGLLLADVMEIEDGPFAAFLSTELAHRADHHLVGSVADLQRENRAVTREGLVRDRDRHEKDDRRRADDPRTWVLGRRSEQKLAALQSEKESLDAKSAKVEEELTKIDAERSALSKRENALVALAEYTAWTALDVDGARSTYEALQGERDRLVAGSSQLVEIDARLQLIGEEDVRLSDELDAASKRIGGLGAEIAQLDARRERENSALEALDSGALIAARELYPALAQRVGRHEPRTLDECDALRENLTKTLTAAVEAAQREMNGYTTSIQQQMAEVLRRWPELRGDMDASILSAGEFRALHERVMRDDLPRFESEFKHQLNTNAVRELAQFHNWLRRQAEEIHDRVARINEALGAIDYNPGRVITLIAESTVNQDIRQFRADLRDATSGILTPDDVDAEQRFEQVRSLIERFRGRENHTESDRTWTQRVTDVRNWFTFAASEQDRETGVEFEHYTDSDGKSGGQKEKLAYTILAASLAYQFGLEWGVERSRDFRFAVIDEAFGRGSDVSTRYALDLFGKLGLQLLIVTPMQKVHVIEPYVSTIGYVDNPSGAASRVHMLTIEEFRERQQQGNRT